MGGIVLKAKRLFDPMVTWRRSIRVKEFLTEATASHELHPPISKDAERTINMHGRYFRSTFRDSKERVRYRKVGLENRGSARVCFYQRRRSSVKYEC
ncbi:MAG: hypothetical protein ACP5SK_05100 [Thermoprotei archaeon]